MFCRVWIPNTGWIAACPNCTVNWKLFIEVTCGSTLFFLVPMVASTSTTTTATAVISIHSPAIGFATVASIVVVVIVVVGVVGMEGRCS